MGFKAHLIDELPLNEDYFICQNGSEPVQLNGEIRLKSIEEVNAEANLALVRDETRGVWLLKRVMTKEKAQGPQTKFVQGVWQGTDLGTALAPYRDVYSRGEFKGLRIENVYGVPEGAGMNVGRIVFNTQDWHLHVDVGGKFKKISSGKFNQLVRVLDGAESLEVDIAGSQIWDARETIWQLVDCSSDNRRVEAEISTPSKSKVQVKFKDKMKEGFFRLIGIE